MSAGLVVALVTVALSGFTGSTVLAEVLVYSPTVQNITIGEQQVTAGPAVQLVHVPIVLREGAYTETISVQTDAIQYSLPVSVTGKKRFQWLWLLLAVPVIVVLTAVRLRRDAGSS
jgi:hypothetical protein